MTRGGLHLSLLLSLTLVGCLNFGSDSALRDGPSLTSIQADKVIASIEFSPDSKLLAHLDASGALRFWDVFGDKVARNWDAEGFAAKSVIVGRNGHFAVASGKEVRVMRMGIGMAAKFFAEEDVAFLQFDALAKSLAVAQPTGKVTVYDIESKKVLREIHPKGEQPVEIVPGAGFGVMYLFPGGKVQIVSCGPRGTEVTVPFARKPNSAVAISDDGRVVSLINDEGEVEIRSIPDGKLRTAVTNLPWAVESMRLSPDGSALAVASSEAGVLLWDTAKSEELDRFASNVWVERGVTFSQDGNFLAWVEENRKVVRFWSPVRGVVQWTGGQPILRERARKVCRSLAETIRFRRATGPFDRGMKELAAGQNDAAVSAFLAAQAILNNYPGLDVALPKARERSEAGVVGGKQRAAEERGEYRVALRLLDAFLRDNAKFDDYGFRERADTLRRMIQHLDSADEHRSAGREVDAVIEFETAARIVPELEQRDTEYLALRKRLLEELARDAREAFVAKNYVKVTKATQSLARLRPLDGESLMRLGVAHELLGNSTQAEKVYLQVAKGTQEYVSARRSIARIARAASDFTKARTHLELAREVVVIDPSLEKEYAEVCQLCKDYDSAVAAWRRVGNLEPSNPVPFSSIATIEEIRERWRPAADALATAIERAVRPRPKLMVRMAKVLRRAGEREKVVPIYLKIAELIEKQPEAIAFLGETPATTVDNWIRELDFVRRRKEWIPREQFLEEQGWERHDGRWLRPREARLREVSERYKKVAVGELRAFSDERYQSYAEEHRITKGMNRREVVKAWGFFGELTVFETGEHKVLFEQLHFEHSRKVYLRNGLVCYWSE
jgi:tetratricopeptide (TPR) repeat protein/WD40 repeat protein